MSSAVIGLLGVLAGTALAGVSEYTLRRRNERRDAQASARLLRDAFARANEMAWNPSPSSSRRYEFSFAVEDWREHRATLARSLKNSEWDDVAAAAQLMAAVDGYTVAEIGTPIDPADPNDPPHSLSGYSEAQVGAGVIALLEKRLSEAVDALERPASGRRAFRHMMREREQLEREQRQHEQMHQSGHAACVEPEPPSGQGASEPI